ncbi:MAG: 2-hydroxyacid dehydrogenase [Verrucomicrobia bacterium]|nr:MAG: 2-hydroxyacid dehydrogenase [Verrucomicrobiota bacterium]
MRHAVFSAKPHDRRFLDAANAHGKHALRYLEARLDRHTAMLANGCEVANLFISDHADAAALKALATCGVKLITLRSAGYNHINLAVARALGITVTHVPDYSPHAVAEHTIALLLSLVRHTPQAYSRVREGNFAIDGLIGFDLHGKTAVIIGTGKIGVITGRILQGFGCRVLAYDPLPSSAAREAGFTFGSLEEVLGEADIVSLHCPLLPATRHLLNRATLGWVKRGAVLINTSRGALIESRALLEAMEMGRLSALGIDVYEDEAPLFYEEHSGQGVYDETLARLITLPNVLVTGHQGFFTREALATIASSCLSSAVAFAEGRTLPHTLTAPATASGHYPPPAPHGSASGFSVAIPPAGTDATQAVA